jgi:hypothetical protein
MTTRRIAMGMDVYGVKPTAAEGEYFRRNVWGWRPLADLCLELAPDECSGCTYWHTNDGDGLDDIGAKRLSAKLLVLIADGSVKAYIAIREAAIANLPRETCPRCKGTGNSSNRDERCKFCDGNGTVKAFAAHYGVTEECVKEFASFLATCGGFSIC